MTMLAALFAIGCAFGLVFLDNSVRYCRPWVLMMGYFVGTWGAIAAWVCL